MSAAPEIRDAMAIDVGGNIVIFDEAHNMEDACREAGSLKVTSEQLLVLKNCISDVREMARKESQMKNEADHALMFAVRSLVMGRYFCALCDMSALLARGLDHEPDGAARCGRRQDNDVV